MESEKRIVIVEDEFLIALEIKKILEKNGYTIVKIIDNGETLLDTIHLLKPDVILMDIQLSGKIDGIFAAEKLENKYSLIYISSFPDKMYEERAKRTNPDGYIVKPFSSKLLLKSVEHAFKSKH